MPSPELIEVYRQAKRGPFTTAESALHLARSRLFGEGPEPIDWAEVRGEWQADFTHDGFHIHACIKVEDHPHLDHLGKFLRDWRPGALPTRLDSDCYQWWLPCNSADDHAEWYRKHGMNKHDAAMLGRKHEREDLHEMLSYGDDWCQVYIVVEASLDGVVLGGASLDGIGIDTIEDLIIDWETWELTHEAVTQAMEWLAEHRCEEVPS